MVVIYIIKLPLFFSFFFPQKYYFWKLTMLILQYKFTFSM